ncbi:shTK domain protein [Cooperia oncophora]
MKGYCTNSAYLSLMKEQCPLTCGYCTGTATTPKPSTCADIRNPRTGENECPGMAAYCRNSAYLSFMREQCPKTCGYC